MKQQISWKSLFHHSFYYIILAINRCDCVVFVAILNLFIKNSTKEKYTIFKILKEDIFNLIKFIFFVTVLCEFPSFKFSPMIAQIFYTLGPQYISITTTSIYIIVSTVSKMILQVMNGGLHSWGKGKKCQFHLLNV